MKYSLDVELAQAVGEAKFELQSVGRMGVVIKKEEASKWDVLCDKKPSNLIVWWDLVEKYESEFKANDEPEETQKKTKKVKKSKKKTSDAGVLKEEVAVE